MNTVSLVIAATMVCVALFAMMETIWTILNRPLVAVERFKRANERSGKSRVYLIAALLGYIGFVYCGFYGLLFWMPPDWGTMDEDGRFTTSRLLVAGLFTFAALPSVGFFERYPQLVRDISMWQQTIRGVEQMIDRVHDLSPVVERFSARPNSAPDELREADFLWLRARAVTLQRNVSNMIENALAIERKRIEQAFLVERKALESKANAATKKTDLKELHERTSLQLSRIKTALNTALPDPKPPVVDVVSLAGTAGDAVISNEAVSARWARLDKIFTAFEVPNGREHDDLRLTDISVALRAAPGLELPAGIEVVGHYRGSSNGGETEIVATLNGKVVDLARSARFAMTLDGICSAFFLIHLAPTHGRFWHGLYDNDYSILLDRTALVAWALQSGIVVEAENPFRALGREPGLRVSWAGSVLTVAALGAGPTTNLTDFSIELEDGRLVNTARQLLLRSNVTVLY